MKGGWSMCAIGLVAAGTLTGPLYAEQQHAIEQTALEVHEVTPAASMLGQFRTSVTSWLWLRTDLYLHNYVEMRPLTQDEHDRGEQGQAAEAHGDLHESESITTVIPSAEHDFRGWLGDVERATHAYKDMHNHQHQDARQVMPLYRLMTLIDPKFTPAWLVGSSVLTMETKSTKTALEFLAEGLRQNPDEPSLLCESGRLLIAKDHDVTRAQPLLEKSIEGFEKLSNLDEGQQTSATWAYRWLSFAYRQQGEFGKERSTALRGLKRFPDDPVLMRVATEPPYFVAPRALEEWRRDHAPKATDPE